MATSELIQNPAPVASKPTKAAEPFLVMATRPGTYPDADGYVRMRMPGEVFPLKKAGDFAEDNPLNDYGWMRKYVKGETFNPESVDENVPQTCGTKPRLIRNFAPGNAST